MQSHPDTQVHVSTESYVMQDDTSKTLKLTRKITCYCPSQKVQCSRIGISRKHTSLTLHW